MSRVQIHTAVFFFVDPKTVLYLLYQPRGMGRELLPEKLGRGVRPASQNTYTTLFMTNICDIPYPIYDLTKNSKPWTLSIRPKFPKISV